MKKILQKPVSTLFLKIVLVIIAIVISIGCAFAFPSMWHGIQIEWPVIAPIARYSLPGFYLTLVPFLISLFFAFRILQHIDRNAAFSEATVHDLTMIKYCAIAMTALYATCMPLAYAVAEFDDAPGLIVIAAAGTCAPLVVATFAAVLQKVLRSAIDLQTEHDLTV